MSWLVRYDPGRFNVKGGMRRKCSLCAMEFRCDHLARHPLCRLFVNRLGSVSDTSASRLCQSGILIGMGGLVCRQGRRSHLSHVHVRQEVLAKRVLRTALDARHVLSRQAWGAPAERRRGAAGASADASVWIAGRWGSVVCSAVCTGQPFCPALDTSIRRHARPSRCCTHRCGDAGGQHSGRRQRVGVAALTALAALQNPEKSMVQAFPACLGRRSRRPHTRCCGRPRSRRELLHDSLGDPACTLISHRLRRPGVPAHPHPERSPVSSIANRGRCRRRPCNTFLGSPRPQPRSCPAHDLAWHVQVPSASLHLDPNACDCPICTMCHHLNP